MLFQLIIMITGYLFGLSIVLLLKLLGFKFSFSNALWLIVIMPIICTCLTETLTSLWSNTPGSMGLGAFIVFIPMVIAGSMNIIVALIAQSWMTPFDVSNDIRSTAFLTEWIIVSLFCTMVTIALWRYWPTPVARLW